jgi:hypothetical protein
VNRRGSVVLALDHDVPTVSAVHNVNVTLHPSSRTPDARAGIGEPHNFSASLQDLSRGIVGAAHLPRRLGSACVARSPPSRLPLHVCRDGRDDAVRLHLRQDLGRR